MWVDIDGGGYGGQVREQSALWGVSSLVCPLSYTALSFCFQVYSQTKGDERQNKCLEQAMTKTGDSVQMNKFIDLRHWDSQLASLGCLISL